jgi:hypothetical protein
MGELKRPSRLTELLRPRKAARMRADLEEAREIEIWHDAEMEEADRAYWRYADGCEYGIQKGNPPDSRELDREIERAAGRYPGPPGVAGRGEYHLGIPEPERSAGQACLGWAEHADERGAGNPPKSILLDEAIEAATRAYPGPGPNRDAEPGARETSRAHFSLLSRREGEQETARHGELRIVADPRLAERNPGRVTRIPDPYGDWTPWGQYWPGREEKEADR